MTDDETMKTFVTKTCPVCHREPDSEVESVVEDVSGTYVSLETRFCSEEHRREWLDGDETTALREIVDEAPD